MKRITLLIITLLLAAISQPAAAAGPLRLAVTTSFAEPAVEIGRLFTRQNGIEVQSTVSSTGKLYAQIISGAPFDLLLAAEADRPQQLHGAGLAEEPVTYGIGRVVLWTAAPERCAATDWLTAFKTGDPRIAIPDPAVAPYGATVMAALKQAGLAEAVASRLVFAHNVGQAFQYGTVKACDLAFVALANALSEPGRTGCYWAVADAPPILHQACIIKNSPNRGAAAAFVELLAGRFRGKVLVEALIGLPLVVPPTVLGFYLLVAMGPQGIVGRAWQQVTGGPLVFTFAGIVAASLVHGLPFAVQPLKAAFEKIDPRLLESAQILGCSRVESLFRVLLPNIKNGLIGAAVLAFAHAMGEFGVVLMVGGSIPGQTKVASIAIYEYVEALRYREAWLLSLALVGASYLILLIVNSLSKEPGKGGRYA